MAIYGNQMASVHDEVVTHVSLPNYQYLELNDQTLDLIGPTVEHIL